MRGLLLTIILTGSFVKLINAQSLIWAKQFTGPYEISGHYACVDASGNVYSIGVFSDSIDLDPGPGIYNLTCAGAYDIYLSKC